MLLQIGYHYPWPIKRLIRKIGALVGFRGPENELAAYKVTSLKLQVV